MRVDFIIMETACTGKQKKNNPDRNEMNNLLCLEEKGSGLGLTVSRFARLRLPAPDPWAWFFVCHVALPDDL